MILITGATGFIGRSLVDRLTETDRTFRAISRNPAQGVHAMGTIDARTDWSEALSGIDTIVHLANRAHVMHEMATDPFSAFRAVNVDATLNLAKQAAAVGVERFIFLSSIKVNGEATEKGQPFTSEDEPAPEDAYGLSKTEAEHALFNFARQSQMELTIIRPPLVYGPGVKANFARLISVVRCGVPLPFGSISNRRSLIFVGNLVDFIIRCIDHQNAAGETFLVSDDHDVSTAELMRELANAMNTPSRLFPFPETMLEMAARVLGRQAAAQRLMGSLQLDISKSKTLLDWAPPYSFSEGLRQTIR